MENCLYMCSNLLQKTDDTIQLLSDEIKEDVLRELDCSKDMSDEEVLEIIDLVLLDKSKHKYISLFNRLEIRRAVFFALRRYDILQELINDDQITEIMINGAENVFYEKNGF